jgi:hypothetical protein
MSGSRSGSIVLTALVMQTAATTVTAIGTTVEVRSTYFATGTIVIATDAPTVIDAVTATAMTA